MALAQEKAELDRDFARATGKTRRMISGKILTDAEVSELQALFRQATEGDGNNWRLLNNPKLFVQGPEMIAHARAWGTLKGMSTLEAMRHYVDLVETLSEKYHVVDPMSRASSVSSVSTTTTYLH